MPTGRRVSNLDARMIVAQTIAELRKVRAKLEDVALVPTMGALHAGHISLIEAAQREAGKTIVSIFVNPTQFGPKEDFTRYPRPFDEDLGKCRRAGVNVVFAPTVEEMYPALAEAPTPEAAAIPTEVVVDIPSLTSVLEGKHRPGHFKGVCQVVAKLFNITQPDVACFGQKDYQQFRVLQAMVDSLDWPIRMIACPTLRDPDGLAMSSRNQYLSEKDRERALSISRALFQAEKEMRSGVDQTNRLIATMQRLLLEQHLQVDYIAAVDPVTLKPVLTITGRTVLAIAARVGNTRLIDNVLVEP